MKRLQRSTRQKRRTKATMNRRMFLRGAGGFALAIPFLPSLLPRRAWSAEPSTASRRMICMTTNHGGVWEEHMYPNAAGLMNMADVAPGHTMHWGPLVLGADGLCPVLNAPSLTPGLVEKMMVLRGLDIPFYIAHHTGGYLGNYARNDGNGSDGQGLEHRPTIDQVMAWSPSFYTDISSITTRSIHIGRDQQQGISWGWSSPASASGTIQNVPTVFGAQELFNDIYVGGEPSTPRTPVVDRILAHYTQLSNGAFGAAQRLSSADRQKLSDYIARLDELDRKLSVTSASCGDVVAPTGNATIQDPGFGGWSEDDQDPNALTCDLSVIRDWYQLFNDVIVAALTCDTSRIVTIHANQTFSTGCNSNAWHQNVAHVANNDAAKEEVLWNSKRWFFDNVFMDLVTKLDAVPDVGGTTLLDNSLVWWTQESGVVTHESDSMPVVAAGSAGGFFQTGMMYDYRNRPQASTLVPPWEDNYAGFQRCPGLLWNQWLATVLQSMGVPPSEFEVGGVKGYGILNNTRPDAYPSYVEAMASDVLPNITA